MQAETSTAAPDLACASSPHSCRGLTGASPRPPESMQGTSMATPVVAGSAALVRQYFMDGYYPSGARGWGVRAHCLPGLAGMPAGLGCQPVQCSIFEPWRPPTPPIRPHPPPAGARASDQGFTPSAALVKAVLLGGAASITGFEADTGLPVDPTPSFRQGFGRVFLGEQAGRGLCFCSPCGLGAVDGSGWLAASGRLIAGREPGHPSQLALQTCCLTLLCNPQPAHRPPTGNSVYLANTPGSRPLSVVDRVPIKQGGWQSSGVATPAHVCSDSSPACRVPQRWTWLPPALAPLRPAPDCGCLLHLLLRR